MQQLTGTSEKLLPLAYNSVSLICTLSAYFECREELLESFDIIPYKVGKTRKELFEEALEYIIKKYS